MITLVGGTCSNALTKLNRELICNIYLYRYVAATWDLDEVEKNWKEKILQQDALVNRLHIPN